MTTTLAACLALPACYDVPLLLCIVELYVHVQLNRQLEVVELSKSSVYHLEC